MAGPADIKRSPLALESSLFAVRRLRAPRSLLVALALAVTAPALAVPGVAAADDGVSNGDTVVGEFMQVCPKDTTPEEWQADLRDVSERLTAACRAVDPTSTDEMIELAHAADVVEGEAAPAAG